VIEVLYLQKPIAGSPYHCQVFDWAKINVSKLPHNSVTDRLIDFDSKLCNTLQTLTSRSISDHRVDEIELY